MNRYNRVLDDGKYHVNDNVNDCTMRSVTMNQEGYRATTAFAKAMNEYADKYKFVSDRICSASVSAVSSLSVNCRSVFCTLELVLIKAVVADQYHARPKSEWNRIANALDHDYLAHHSPDRIDRAWRRLVQYGFVRSYTKKGKRLYELNLVEDVEHA